jgi:hypothetical protein
VLEARLGPNPYVWALYFLGLHTVAETRANLDTRHIEASPVPITGSPTETANAPISLL